MKIPSRLLLLCCFAAQAAAGLVHAAEPAKQPLRVLYVGGSIDWTSGLDDLMKAPPPDDPRVQHRMQAFASMLSRYFDSVTVIHAKDYRQEKSADFDVTILDGTPPERELPRQIKDAAGRVVDIIPERYFTEDFDRPVVVIGELGDRLCRRIGLKFDWYCLCLDAYAHSFRAAHPIFHGPFPVSLTIEELPTPEDAFHYGYFRDDPTPKTLPMWRVQTKGYQTDKGFRIGMVARPWGFEDSPDAEYISSGVCQKTLAAVAIGRHGNFLGWGFAASPEYLTPEAQTVLANAVCYIAKFNGQGLIARKYHDRRATKEWVREIKYLATPEAHAESEKRNEVFAGQMLATRRTAEEKQARGEKLSAQEQASLRFTAPKTQSFADYLKGRRGVEGLFARFGTDYRAYHRFYDENGPWLYSVAPFYQFELDEDARSLGVPNTDLRLLDRAIALWESGADAAKARRILTRYTLLDYETPQEWRAWFGRHKAELFFTQSGGWVFMVGNRHPGDDSNDYGRRAREQSRAALATGKTDDASPVAATAALIERGDGRREIVLKLSIRAGYHLYSYVAPSDAFIPTLVEVLLPPGYQAIGSLSQPPSTPYNAGGTTGLYTGTITFVQAITGSGAGVARVKLSYQCCDDSVCLPPVDREFTVQLN
ncbi:MAG: hypothetical protein HYV75_07320 [Opitutae bacterium]|nr:hypothetical protein [Opitutae bacterium]